MSTPSAETSSSPSALASRTTTRCCFFTPALASASGVRRGSEMTVPTAVPATRVSVPSPPVAASQARSSQLARLLSGKLTAARTHASPWTPAEAALMPRPVPSVTARPEKQLISAWEWLSARRCARWTAARAARVASVAAGSGRPVRGLSRAAASPASVAAHSACLKPDRPRWRRRRMQAVRGGPQWVDTPDAESASSEVLTRLASTKPYSSSASSALRTPWRVTSAESGASLRRPEDSMETRQARTVVAACSVASTSSRSLSPRVAPSSLPWARSQSSSACWVVPESRAALAARRVLTAPLPVSSRPPCRSSRRSKAVRALKKSFSSAWKVRNSATKGALYWPGNALMRCSIASVATRSSGPALRCSLFWMVCLISCFRSLGMSLRWAMSRMRVRGTAWVKEPLKEGSQGRMARQLSRDSSSTPGLP